MDYSSKLQTVYSRIMSKVKSYSKKKTIFQLAQSISLDNNQLIAIRMDRNFIKSICLLGP